ncbi:MAG: hypothetical protein JSU08_05865 [Acidobacteria bacterium]|nr:hypothetical protein [Acidobacteriota bacterium]
MNDGLCTYDGRRDEVLMEYLYDHIDREERAAFERHLAGCIACRTELDALGDVRDGLAAWAAPEVADGVGGTAPRVPLRLVEPTAPRPSSGWRVIADAPIWLQAAAAMLVVAASLGIANINLTYSRNGLTLTTGWMQPAPGTQADAGRAAGAAANVSAAGTAPGDTENARLRAEIVALRQQMDEVKTLAAAAASARTDNDALVRQVRAEIQDSERRVMRDVGLQVAGVARDFQVQRQADLVNIDRNMGLIQNRTGMEVLRQQQQLNNLLQRVSEQK